MGALFALNVLSYVDRQALAAAAPLVIAEMGLTRAQMGLLIGTSFIVVYAFATLAVGVLADRWSRPRLMAWGLGVWSVATSLTALAPGFHSLAAARALVGLGEAALPATALSMIGDRVPPARLGLANGVFYAGIPVGFALSFVLTGALAPGLGWRACFLVLGGVGLLAVPALARMPDPARRGMLPSVKAASAAWPRALVQRPTLGLLFVAGGLLVFASASAQHAITWLVQERGFEYRPAALLSAVIVLGAGLAGSVGLGVVSDRANRRHPGGRLLALAVTGALGLGASAVFYRAAPDSPVFFAAWILSHAWLFGWFGPFVAAVDERSPAGLRASLIGAGLLVLNLAGVGSGPYLTGLLGDRAGLGPALTLSLLPAALGVALLAGLGAFELRRSATTAREDAAGLS